MASGKRRKGAPRRRGRAARSAQKVPGEATPSESAPPGVPSLFVCRPTGGVCPLLPGAFSPVSFCTCFALPVVLRASSLCPVIGQRPCQKWIARLESSPIPLPHLQQESPFGWLGIGQGIETRVARRGICPTRRPSGQNPPPPRQSSGSRAAVTTPDGDAGARPWYNARTRRNPCSPTRRKGPGFLRSNAP